MEIKSFIGMKTQQKIINPSSKESAGSDCWKVGLWEDYSFAEFASQTGMVRLFKVVCF